MCMTIGRLSFRFCSIFLPDATSYVLPVYYEYNCTYTKKGNMTLYNHTQDCGYDDYNNTFMETRYIYCVYYMYNNSICDPELCQKC